MDELKKLHDSLVAEIKTLEVRKASVEAELADKNAALAKIKSVMPEPEPAPAEA